MGMFDIFKSAKKSNKNNNSHAQDRALQRSLDNLGDKIQNLEKEKAKIWQAAKLKTAQGLKQDAARLLQQYKQKDVMVARLNRQLTFIEHKRTEIDVAVTTAGAIGSLRGMVDANSDCFDAEKMDEMMKAIENCSADIQDMNKSMDRAFVKQDEQLSRMYEEAASNMDADDDLMAMLEAEVAGEISCSVKMTSENNTVTNVKKEFDLK